MVPVGDWKIPLGEAEVVRKGRDVSLLAWGRQLHTMLDAADMAMEQLGRYSSRSVVHPATLELFHQFRPDIITILRMWT